MATPRLNVQTGLVVCALLYGGYKLFDKPAEYEVANAKRLAPPSREKRAIEQKAYMEKTREYSEARAKGLAAPPTASSPPPATVKPVVPPPTAVPVVHSAPWDSHLRANAAQGKGAPPPAAAARDMAAASPPMLVREKEREQTEDQAEAQPKVMSLKERLEQRSFTSKPKTGN